MDSNVGGADVRGYLETDFPGIVPGNVAVTSNSDTLRLRLPSAGRRSELWLPGEDGLATHAAKEPHTHHTVKVGRKAR